MMNILKTISEKLQSLFNYQGVINTQIRIYNRIKKYNPEMSENERLNYLINTRIRSLPRVASREEEQSYYDEILDKPNKTLEEVLWVIVGYEFIQSRRVELFEQGYKRGLSTEEIGRSVEDLKRKIKKAIKESISKNEK